MDIILGDISFTFPLDKVNYTDRDIITWGGKKAILAGDAYNGAAHTSPEKQIRPSLCMPALDLQCPVLQYITRHMHAAGMMYSLR